MPHLVKIGEYPGTVGLISRRLFLLNFLVGTVLEIKNLLAHFRNLRWLIGVYNIIMVGFQ